MNPARRREHLPQCWPWSRWIGRVLLALLGWKVEGRAPPVNRAVVIACPHTSNWDYFYALLAGWVLGISFQWIGKDSLFRPPLGILLRLLGGIGVDRSAPQGFVAAVAERFRTEQRLLLMVPAEGTRAYRNYWKSGFYFIAHEANVPIILGFLDFSRKIAGFGPAVNATGDIAADMDVIRAFYADKAGKHPRAKGRIRLRNEDEPGQHPQER